MRFHSILTLFIVIIFLSELTFAMPNPSAVYCKELGYSYEIKSGEKGEYGVCILPNVTCRAWDFFRGVCGKEFSFCSKLGYKTLEGKEEAICEFFKFTNGKFELKKIPVGKLMGLEKKLNFGFKSKPKKRTPLYSPPLTSSYNASDFSFWDWRNPPNGTEYSKYNFTYFDETHGWLSPVKDQGGCGSCWAFASVGTVEAKYNIERNESRLNPDLSEEYLVSDCHEDYTYNLYQDCCGGFIDDALEFIKTGGFGDENCFPYVDDSSCECSSFHNCDSICTYYTGANCSDTICSDRCSEYEERLWNITGYGGPLKLSINQTKQYLIDYGPLAGGMGILSSVGGAFDSNCIYRCTDDKTANHAVIIVGYNDTGNESTSYWIVKNSWGSDWPSGECNMGGYFKLGFNECNLTEEIEYVLSVNPPNFKPKVVLNSPENGTKLPPQVFKFNFTVYTKNSTTAQCDLLINEEVKNTTSTQNSTPTVISYNLTSGVYEWKVACWENKIGILNSSETRVLTVGYEINILIQSPQNATYASLPISLNVTTDTPADSCWWNLNDTANTTMLNSSQTSWYDTIDSCAPGTQHLFVYCNNTQGDVNSNSSVWFTYDPTPPKYYNETSSPSSPTPYSPLATYLFNITWLEPESALSEVWIEHNFTGAMQNVTVTNNSGNVYTFTFSDLPAGTYVYRWHANNSANEMNSSPFYTYTVEKASRTLYLNFDKPSPQEYGIPLTVSCFVSQGGGEVKLYRNVSGYVDVSEENNESVILPAGAWSYLCNVTEGENYTSASNSSIFVVTKAKPQLFLESNCSWNAVYETVCNQTGFVTSGDASAIKKLYRNESGWVEKAQGSPASEVVMLGVGSHQYNYTYEESENYSTKNITNVLVITPKNARVRVYPQTQTITYGQSVVQFCLDDSALLDCSLYRNGSLIQNSTQATLPPGVYIYSANISDSQNYTNYENSSILTVEKALPQGSLSGTNVTYPNSVNVVPSETNSGDADVNYTLWRNGTLVSSALGTAPSPDITQLPAGTYIYVFNSSEGENYSSATISTLTVIVSKTPTSIKLYLNGSEWTSNQTFEYPHVTRVNATINVSSLQPNVTLLVNSSSVSNPYETLHTPGTYNYTAIFEGNENYTSSSITRFLTIQDTTPPNISSASAFPTVVEPNENVTIFAKVNDNFGVKYVSIEVYNSSSNLVYEENLTQKNGGWMLEFNMSFPQGKYILNLTAVDNSGLESTEWVKNVTVSQSSAGEVFENDSISTLNNFTTINTPIDVSLEITTTLEIENFTIIAVRYLENPVGEEPQPSLKYIEVGTTPEVEESLLWNVLKVYYTDEEVSSAGLDENTLRIYYYNETSEEWDLEPGGVNTTSNYVWCNVTHFSIYGVFGQTTTSTTSTTTTVGGGGGGSVVRSETSSTTSTSTTVKPRVEIQKEVTSSTTTTSSTSTTYVEPNPPPKINLMSYVVLLLILLLFLLIIMRRI